MPGACKSGFSKELEGCERPGRHLPNGVINPKRSAPGKLYCKAMLFTVQSMTKILMQIPGSKTGGRRENQSATDTQPPSPYQLGCITRCQEVSKQVHSL